MSVVVPLAQFLHHFVSILWILRACTPAVSWFCCCNGLVCFVLYSVWSYSKCAVDCKQL